jgi:hypothetical protein
MIWPSLQIPLLECIRYESLIDGVPPRIESAINVNHVAFVVAAPDHNRCVVAQPCNDVGDFCCNLSQEFIAFWVFAAGEEKILPNHQAQPGGLIIEGIGLCGASTPDSNHVHISFGRCAEKGSPFLICDCGGKDIRSLPVGSADEHWLAIDSNPKVARLYHV